MTRHPAHRHPPAAKVPLLTRVWGFLPPAYRPTQKWTAGALAALLAGLVTQVAPVGLSTQLGGIITVVAALAAHYLVPGP